MSRPIVDELEERRVVRLLAGVAAEVAPLADAEVDALLARAGAARPAAPRPRRVPVHVRPRHYLPALAAAATVAVAVGLGSSQPRSRPLPPATGGAAAQPATFPEGSALRLLLSRVQGPA